MTGQPMTYDWCVVGGGMAGIYAAYRLAKAGASVSLVEASDSLGGVLASREWRGFHVDNGCHLLDYGNRTSADFFDAVMGGDVLPVDVRYASINRGQRSDGIAVSDFSCFPAIERSAMLVQVEDAAQRNPSGGESGSLADALTERFGALAGEELALSVPKLCGGEAGTLSAEALEILSYYKRIRLGDDETMAAIKAQSPALDDRLAVSTRGDHLLFQETKGHRKWRNYYPTRRGMQEFCNRSEALLRDLGVDVLTSFRAAGIEVGGEVTIAANEARLSAEKVYWTLPQPLLAKTLGVDADLSGCFHPVSVHLFAYCLSAAEVGPYTYIHDYTPDRLTFRSSASGVYGRQIDEQGRTFVIAEVYDTPSAPRIASADGIVVDVWDELQQMGQVGPQAVYEDVSVSTLKVALMLPREEWIARRPIFDQRLSASDGRIIRPPLSNRGKRNIFRQVEVDLALS